MRKTFLAVGIFLILLIIFTYPLITNLNSCIPGFFSSDEPYNALWDSWRVKYSLSNNFSLNKTFLIAYPFGIDLYSSGYFCYLFMGLFYCLSGMGSPVLTYNFIAFSNVFLVGMITYLLVFYLTKNRLSAIFSGIIFAFCPYMFLRVWQHLGLTYSQWIPLALFSLILLREKLLRRYFVLCLVSVLAIFSFDYSVMYFCIVSSSAFISYVIFYNFRAKLFKQRKRFLNDLKYLKKITVVGALALVILSPQFFPLIKGIKSSKQATPSAFNGYYRPFQDLFSQSARPLSYFLPAAVHPLFGGISKRFIGSSLYGESFTEHTLYLGWFPLIFAFFAFRKWRRLRKINNGYAESRDNFYIGFFIFLTVTAWFFSQPPWWKIGSLKIFMPSFFMYKILPMYRAYCRFGIVVMLAVAVLAGYGLKFILEKFKSKLSKISITGLFCCLVLFEFWNYPPFKVIDVVHPPEVYQWMKNQPGKFAIAEYPLDTDGSGHMYRFYQIFHSHPIINATIPGSYANEFAKTITDLSNLKTSSVLKGMGVKYVLVHKDAYIKTEIVEEIDEFNNIFKNKGLKLVKSFPPQECPSDIMCVQKTGPIDVYEVIAEKEEPEVL